MALKKLTVDKFKNGVEKISEKVPEDATIVRMYEDENYNIVIIFSDDKFLDEMELDGES